MPEPQQTADKPAEATSAGLSSYFERRLDPQLRWHEATASRAKAMYYRLSAVQMVAMSLVPVVNTFPSGEGFLRHTVVTSVLAAVAAVATGLLALGRHQETWLRSRRTAALLDSARMRADLGLSPFEDAQRVETLVEECEAILSGEMDQWSKQFESSRPDNARSRSRRDHS